MKSSKYWKARMEAVEAAGYKIGYESYKESEAALNLAEQELLKQIEKWVNRIAEENGISYAKARQMLTKGELEEFKWDVNQYIEKGRDNALSGAWMHELENASARAHISRLEAMRLQLRQYIEEAYSVQLGSTRKALTSIYESEYYHTAYEIQKGVGVGWQIGGINTKAVDRVLAKPWTADGHEFSVRIWDSRAEMVGKLHQELTRQIITGDAPDKAITELSKYVKQEAGRARQKAGTLVMTEAAAIGNQAQHDCFKDLDVEQFEVVETLDSHTCETCGDMDGRHYPMTSFEIGVTAPPFHPNCRGCIAPYFDDEFQPKKRAARDEETGETVMVDNMTYKEWKKEFVVDGAQEYREVKRGEERDFHLGNGETKTIINAKRVTTYSTPVYVSDKASIKPKLLQRINKNTEDAMKLYGIDEDSKPTIVIAKYTELGNTAGKYDPKTNTVYYSDGLKNKAVLEQVGGESMTEYHEIWHARQAEEFRKAGWVINKENYRAYIEALDAKCKARLARDRDGVYNTIKESTYARCMMADNRFSEVEAEYIARNRGKAHEWILSQGKRTMG